MYGDKRINSNELEVEKTRVNEMIYANMIAIINNFELREALTDEEFNVIKRALIKHAVEEATYALTNVSDNDRKKVM